MTNGLAAKVARAIELHQAGRLAEAAKLYAEVVEADRLQYPARHNLGMVLLGLGQVDRALTELRRALLEDGDNPGWTQSLPVVARRLYESGHWEVAAEWITLALDRVDDPGLVALAERLAPRGYLAEEVYDPLLERSLKRYVPRESATWVYAIDVVGTCNLRCPTCPVGNFPAAERNKGFMDVALFRRIVDKIRAESPAPRPELFLFNWGEPLLHPEIGQLIEIARSAGLAVHLSSNLNVERGIKEVAKANPENFKISLSGFTPETYAIGHVRGDLQLLKANMQLLRHFLDKYHATTRVWVGQHLYKHNQHEVGLVAEACRELDFEHHPIVAFYQPLERLLRMARGEKFDDPILERMLEHPRDYLPRLRAQRSGRYDCELRFNQTAINFDGSVALCCSVYDKPNMIADDFLAHDHDELQARKYAHPFCRDCMAHGLSYAPAEIAAASGSGPATAF